MIVCCEMKLSEHRSLLPIPTRQSAANGWQRSLDNHCSYPLPCEPGSSNHHSSIQPLEQQLWISDDSNVPCGKGIDDSNSIFRYDRDLWWLSIAKNSISPLCPSLEPDKHTEPLRPTPSNANNFNNSQPIAPQPTWIGSSYRWKFSRSLLTIKMRCWARLWTRSAPIQSFKAW